MTAPNPRAAVLGLDLSLVRAGITAIARDPLENGKAAPVLLTDVGHGGSNADSYADRRKRIRAQVHSIIRIISRFIDNGWQPVLAVIEGPAYGMKTLPSFYDRAIVWGGVCDWLDLQNIPIAVVNPSTREKFITGVGSKGDKKRVLAEMRALWFPDNPRAVPNHDVADALGLATAGVLHLDWPVPFTPRRRHIENVAQMTWPERTPA